MNLAPAGVRADVVAMLTAALDAFDQGPGAARFELLDTVTASLEDPAATACEVAYLAAAFLSAAAPQLGRTPAALIQSLAASGQERGTPEAGTPSTSASGDTRPGAPPTTTTPER